MDELLKVEHLAVSFQTDAGELEAVRDVSFSLRPGEVLAIVGESGCGKSVLCKSIMKLLPEKAKIKSGSIRINDTDISACKEKEMQDVYKRQPARQFRMKCQSFTASRKAFMSLMSVKEARQRMQA